MNDLASVLSGRGKYEEAEKMYPLTVDALLTSSPVRAGSPQSWNFSDDAG
jgi:hypothetical protein